MDTPLSAPIEKPPGIALFRALRSRNYQLFFIGQTISLCGTFLTQIATSWLIYRLTGSALMLGTVAFAGQIPLFFLAPFGGVWVDRWNKRKLLVTTQILAMLQSLGLAALAFTHIEVWHVVAMAFAQGLINSFDMPARQAFVVDMVEDRADLANAIALNSTMVHAARLIGPALGGLLIDFVGEGTCFLIDGASYIAVILSLLMMSVVARPKPPRDRSALAELREGVAYAWNNVPIRVLLMFMAILSLTAMPAYNVLMPIFAKTLGGETHGAKTLGVLIGASAMGALSGAIYLASRKSVLGLGRVISIASLTFALAILAFSYSTHLWLSLFIAPLAGYGMLATFASANTLVQTLADDDKRGRVMSLFTVAFLGMAPFGNLLTGFAAKHLGDGFNGATRTLALSSAIALSAAGMFAATLPMLRKIIRPIYVERGIIREVAGGLEEASNANE